MIPVVLFVAALLVRAVVGALFTGPAYPDSYYYANVAQQLAAGHGLTVDYIWNFVDVGGRLPTQATLPIAANAHWMPLAELVQVPFIWVLGATPLAAMLPFWIIGALAAPLTFWIARDAQFSRSSAVAAALMVAAPGALTPYFSQPDNFGLFITLGAGSLWLCARGLRGDRRAFVVGGALVGLAALARSDGVLLGLPFALVGVRDLWRSRLPTGSLLGWRSVTGCALAFALVVVAWLVRQDVVFGSPLPSADSGILWLRDYSQLFSVGDPATVNGWLAQGAGPLLASRIGGLAAAVGLFALLPLVVVLAPFAVIGAWRRRHDIAFAPFLVYAGALFAASGLLFAVHVPHGTFIHSAAALLPHTFLLVIVGVEAAVEAAARRRPSWHAPQATRVFVAGASVVTLFGAIMGTLTTVGQWQAVRAPQLAVTRAFADIAGTDLVMSADPGAVRWLTGHGGIVTPNDTLPVIEQALRDYDVRWLLLERAQIVPALAPILTGDEHPTWLSSPVATSTDRASAAGAGRASVPVPGAVLYAVCLAPTDTRCTQ